MKKKIQFLNEFIQSNFFIDRDGDLHYKWQEDTSAFDSEKMVKYIEQNNLNVADSRKGK